MTLVHHELLLPLRYVLAQFFLIAHQALCLLFQLIYLLLLVHERDVSITLCKRMSPSIPLINLS